MEDKVPSWCYRGGSFRLDSKPGDWFKKTSGQWNKKELVPYGKANEEYQTKNYLCPECDNRLFPMDKQYRFHCSECQLIFAYGFGGLYGFGNGHEKAEYNMI
jgi:ribosomal protein S27AE